MPEIDLDPGKYRKRDPQTGRWRWPLDKKTNRIMMFVALGMMGLFLWVAFRDGWGHMWAGFVAFGAFGFCAGGLWVMSLKSTDW